MQRIIQKNILVKLSLFGLSLVFFATLLIATKNEKEPNKIQTDTNSEKLFEVKENAKFNYPVSGVVEAVNTLTVRAKTGGTVTKILRKEGAFVGKNDILVVQTIPLLENKIDLQNTQNTLSKLAQNNALIQTKTNLDKSLVGLNSSKKTFDLTLKNISQQDKNTASLLATQANASALTLISTLNFIDEYESYFPSKTLKEFKKTVTDLYGEEKTYITGYVKYNFKSNENILDKLKNMTIETYPDLKELIDISTSIDEKLGVAKKLLEDAEYKFLDSHTFSTTDSGYTSYISNRASVMESQANLRKIISNANSLLIQNDISLLNSDTNNKLSFINSQSADSVFGNQNEIYNQTEILSKKQLDLLNAQKDLGVSRSPIKGIVKDVFVDYGEYIMPGTPILTLVGNTAQEIKVTVPKTILPMLKVGDIFLIDGKNAGHIDRFAPVLNKGRIEVFISLENPSFTDGESINGEIQIMLENSKDIAYIPREYLHFNNSGGYVITNTNEKINVSVVYDAGSFILIKSKDIVLKKLIPSKGISF